MSDSDNEELPQLPQPTFRTVTAVSVSTPKSKASRKTINISDDDAPLSTVKDVVSVSTPGASSVPSLDSGGTTKAQHQKKLTTSFRLETSLSASDLLAHQSVNKKGKVPVKLRCAGGIDVFEGLLHEFSHMVNGSLVLITPGCVYKYKSNAGHVTYDVLVRQVIQVVSKSGVPGFVGRGYT